MSSDSFLDSSDLTPSKLKVIYQSSPSRTKQPNLVIYEDDTCKDIYIKLAQITTKRVSSDMIVAWYKHKQKIHTLGFSYDGIECVDPFKINSTKLLDPRFITKEGSRVALNLDTDDMSVIISELPVETLYYTTWYDYLSYLKFPDSLRKLTDEECQKYTNTTCQELYGGFIRRYWPRLSQEDSFELTTKIQSDKIKLETTLYKENKDLCELLYSVKPNINPIEYRIPLCILDNRLDSENQTNVALLRLFSDIELGEFTDYESHFSKIVLDDYGSTYAKLLRSKISYTGVEKDRYISQDIFLKWFKPQQTSIPNTPLTLMDDRNSIQFKLVNSKQQWVTLILYVTGDIKLVFTDVSSYVFTRSYIRSMIQIANRFIEFINRKQVFSQKPLQELSTDFKQGFHFMSSSIVYPVKDYQTPIIEKLLTNLQSFVRFNKSQDMLVSVIYKRTSHYDTNQSKLRVISLLHHSRRKLKRNEIIQELEKIFNLSLEEATDEYEQWELLSNGGKIFQKGENGIECIFDLVGTNIKVDISGTSSYAEFSRIQKFMDRVLTIYNDFIETQKDTYKLFKSVKQSNQYERAEQVLLADQLDTAIIQEDVAVDVIDDSPIVRDATADNATADDATADDATVDNATADDDTEELNMPRLESGSDSDDDSSEELNMRRLESDSEDSDSSRGGYLLQRGGYNVNRYYLERLKKFDKELFDGYSVKRTKHSSQGSVGYTYARKCGSQYGRQPIAIKKQELERIEAYERQNGKHSFTEAMTVEGRDPENYYICPKYWDVKNEMPLDPKDYESFKQHIVDNKMTSAQKKKTDKYVLVRDETYWREAGDDISRYKIELWEDFHPKGYKVPCCRAPRKGHDEFSVDWKVEVYKQDEDGKYEWIRGTVVKDLKDKVKVDIGIGNVITVEKKMVRRARDSKTITSSFPSNLGNYGHVNPIIKQLVKQKITEPEISSENNVGLIRRGVKRGSSIGDHTLLDSLVEILRKSSVKQLKQDIIYDLNQYPYLLSIAGGSFINKFKFDFDTISDEDALLCLDRMGPSSKPRHPKYFRFIKPNQKKYSPKELFHKISAKYGGRETAKLMDDMRQYTAKVSFQRYLEDDNEIILDTYLSPVLTSLSQLPNSRIFKDVVDSVSDVADVADLSNVTIVTFEGTHEDVKLSIPLGGYPEKINSLILLYKERGFHYEPILYRRFADHTGIIQIVKNPTHIMYDQNDSFQSIISSIQKLIQSQQTDPTHGNVLMDVSELTNRLNELNLTIIRYIYDNYSKIIMVQCDNQLFIPVKPSPIEPYYPLKQVCLFSNLKESAFPSLKDQFELFQLLDQKHTYQKYCDGLGMSVVNSDLEIYELILQSGHYVPVAKEIYNRKNPIHKQIDIVSTMSYRYVDEYVGIQSNYTDKRKDYYNRYNYRQIISQLFYQKAFFYLQKKSSLYNSVLAIKHHPIKLRVHQSKELVELLYKPLLDNVIEITKESYSELTTFETGYKLILAPMDEIKAIDIYKQCLSYFCELLLIYSESDYTRFTQLHMTIPKVKQSLQDNVLLFNYQDIKMNLYLEHFQRYSQYINSYTLYGEGISRSKINQLHRLKQVIDDRSFVEFTKQYPRIINQLCGRNLRCDRYPYEQYQQLKVISKLLFDPTSGEENMYRLYSIITQQERPGDSFEQEAQSYKIEPDGLVSIANETGVGFCLISQITTKLLQHDVYVILPRVEDESELDILVLYQTETSLIHVMKNDLDMIPLSVLNKQKRFQQEYKRPYSQQVD